MVLAQARFDASSAFALLSAVRTGRRKVHCLTSPVAAERTANTLLALGVRPSLSSAAEDVADFVHAADALLINLGMLTPERAAAIPAAVAAAGTGKPWVLDPVFAEVSPARSALAVGLLSHAPTVLKVNTAESALLADAGGETVRVVTGARDSIAQGTRRITIANGHPLAGCVTAMGCALGAIIAAFASVEADKVSAAAAACLVYAVAMEIAAEGAHGPASFAGAIIDALYRLDRETLIARARIA